MQPGRSQLECTQKLDARLLAELGGREPEGERAPPPPTEIREGMVRRAEFLAREQAGYTVSQCIALEAGYHVKWQQLESHKKGMNLCGVDGRRPEFSIRLSDDPRGTVVQLAYDYLSATDGGLDALRGLLEQSAALAVSCAGFGLTRPRGHSELCTGFARALGRVDARPPHPIRIGYTLVTLAALSLGACLHRYSGGMA